MISTHAKKVIYGIAFGFLLLGVTSSIGVIAQGGDIWTICPEGPPVCTSASMQEAAALASDGSTLLVSAGQYAGPVIVAKNLTIIGAGQVQTVVTRGIIVAGPFRVTLRALQVTAGLNGVQGQAAPGLPEIFSPFISLESVTLTGNAANGIALFNSAAASMSDVHIHTNGISIQGQPIGGGVALRGNSRALIGGNSVIEKNGANGILTGDNASLTMSGGIVQMNQLSGIQLGGSSTASIGGITAQANGCYGIDVVDNSSASVSGSTFQGNARAGMKAGGPSSTLVGCGTNTDSELHATLTMNNNIISGNPVGLLVGDLSKDLEQATVSGIGNAFIGNGQNLVIDPVGTKSVNVN